MKKCGKCGKMKDRSEFYPRRDRDGGRAITSWCKERQKDTAKKWNKDNKGKANERQRARFRANPERERGRLLNNRLKMQYGITLEQYKASVASQGGVCKICGSPPNGKRLVVDHCHNSSKVRGLLCEPCNVGLGMFKDNPHTLLKAKEYLEVYYASKA